MPAISNQFTIEALDGYPQDPTKIEDVRHIAATPFQVPTTCNRSKYGICCIQACQIVAIEIGAVTTKGFLGSKSDSNPLPTTVAVQDLSPHIIFIRMSPGVLDLVFMCKLSILRGINRNIAKMACLITKVN